MGHPPTINQCRATDPASIGVPFGKFDETMFVLHMVCPDDFWRPPPPRTVMGHPPTINQCRATDPASIGVPFGMFFFFQGEQVT